MAQRPREPEHVIPEAFAEAARFQKSRCMSMMSSAVAAQSSPIGSGSAASFPEFAMTFPVLLLTVLAQRRMSLPG